jgi:hypothetical protein
VIISIGDPSKGFIGIKIEVCAPVHVSGHLDKETRYEILKWIYVKRNGFSAK